LHHSATLVVKLVYNINGIIKPLGRLYIPLLIVGADVGVLARISDITKH